MYNRELIEKGKDEIRAELHKKNSYSIPNKLELDLTIISNLILKSKKLAAQDVVNKELGLYKYK